MAIRICHPNKCHLLFWADGSWESTDAGRVLCSPDPAIPSTEKQSLSSPLWRSPVHFHPQTIHSAHEESGTHHWRLRINSDNFVQQFLLKIRLPLVFSYIFSNFSLIYHLLKPKPPFLRAYKPLILTSSLRFTYFLSMPMHININKIVWLSPNILLLV